tara:strand:- start:11174 stop:11881 length:708 start_codon:yes stop_codon:yes gene_type:complete
MNTWFVDNWLRPVFVRNCLLGTKAYYKSKDFGPTAELESRFQEILSEFNLIKHRIDDFSPFQDISPDQVYISNDDKWKMFFLMSAGYRFNRSCQEFPVTMEILDKYPEIVSAYFSVLGPKKMLNPHRGPWSGVFRMHLGLIIPTEGKGCTLVNNCIPYKWKAGEVVVFDDTYEHFAVNATNEDRIVLFLDILRPLPPFWHVINKLLIMAARLLPYFREPIKRHAKWEREFYASEE